MLRAFVPGPDDALVSVDPRRLDITETGWVWIDLVPDSETDVESLGEMFHLNRHAVEDASTDVHFPKLDDFGDHLFVVVHGIADRGGRLDTVELDAFLGERFLITVHRAESPSIEWVIEHGSRGIPGPDVVLARLIDTSSHRLLPLIEALDRASDDLEERAIEGDGAVVPEIHALRRDAVRLRRVLGPQRDVLAELGRPTSRLVGERARQRFSSAHDHLVRVVENLDTARILFGSILDAYRGAVAEKLNEVMKVLTVYAAILLPLTLIAGIYGMNFTNMPELQWRWGYFALVGVMAAVALGQWVYFARRGFIGAFSFRKIPRTVGRGLARIAVLPVDAVALAARGLGNREAGSEPGDSADSRTTGRD